MSSFGAKRKARVIKTSEDDDTPSTVSSSEEGNTLKDDAQKPTFVSKGRKPFRQSGLRKTISAADDESKDAAQEDDQEDGPAVVRPNINRNGSSMRKRPAAKSKLSFAGDAGDERADEEPAVVKPLKKNPIGKKAIENSAARKGIVSGGLPFRSQQDDDDRPRYSKEYLSELQSSTPNTPRDVSVNTTDNEMDLDPSELEGAMIVESSSSPKPNTKTQILTEAEVKEKKERRARLALEQDFLAVDEDEDDDRYGLRKKPETRLKAEDEELGEGFDDYVEDGGLSLGKRAERERKKQDRKQMAELISAAEGHSSDSSEDSDAERRIAYEAAQTRAGMDGLKKARKDPAEELLKVPSKITPIPSLTECIGKLQLSLRTMEADLRSKEAHVQKLRDESAQIAKREEEVQALLDETGKQYQNAMGKGNLQDKTAPQPGVGAEMLGERGLESMGTTPHRNGEDVEV
ncbi:nineteen complex-related protein 2-domain-containing protein [Emericellopsis atlantica]|uniref:Nineteen complex-related protein 2-domain-containing protein n=1 Tax=Emericellopsis atlantica TaxID=2614577 RepID=A0A9P7ZUS3_9HYPO|nr:nineteen complex-related protein 2-domain-containing protein [Emericellopsis atlantica]KAG9258137.1 nineteen complex-related protein 2-domain-containing protein [Emericellopsis atlantica]